MKNYDEFTNSVLVSIYNDINRIDSYKDFFLNIAKEKNPKTIIDIGCGTGLLTCELSSVGFDMIGIEPAEEMLEIARKSDCGQNVDWILGDASSIEEMNADMVIMSGHVAQFYLEDEYWNKALKLIYYALDKNGYLIFDARNPEYKPWFKNWPDSFNSAYKVQNKDSGEVGWWWEHIKTEDEFITYNNCYYLQNIDKTIKSTNKLVFRSKETLVNQLKSVGFQVESIYGDWDKSQASENREEMIFVVRKGEKNLKLIDH